ncbi:ATP-binding protein [Halobaculum sp. D14]|uniref:ATP-binding protein n=1 Tax=unclassified Halobaculum TaxID=2640896 RepID=UPI003EBD1B3C
MTSLNLTPITKDDQPTSHVTVGRSKVGPGADVVRVRHAGREAFFRVRTEDDGFASTIKNKVYLNSNVARLFGGIDRTSDFYVDADVSLGAVRSCKRAELYAENANEEALADALRSNQYLLHPIREVAEFGDEQVEFTVDTLEPAATTLRVDDDTELEFLDEPPAASLDEPPTGTGGGDGASSGGPGGPGGRGGPGGGGGRGAEEDATIDITPTNPQVNFEEDVAGLEEVKRTAEMVLSLFEPDVRDEVVSRYGEEFADRGGGMLLYGPPGCGKTLVSEAIAYEAKYNSTIEDSYGEVVFLQVRGSDVVSKYAGESEKNVRAAFEQAHEAAGDGFAVLFFDEVETLIPDRSDDNLQRHERALTNAFLQEMNDVEDNLLVIGATNMPFSIDPAATRRFPIQQFIPQPDEDVMAQVWEKSLGRIAENGDVDVERLGEASVGYTPAEIADRVLGSELQRELVESVIDPDEEAITPNTEYLLSKLDDMEPKTVRQYVSSVMKQASELEGYPEMKAYIEQQAQEIAAANAPGPGEADAGVE